MRSETTVPRVLIADDQPDVLEALRLLLKGEGYRIESAGSPAAILEAIDGDEFDAVLMDLNYARDTTSGQEGLDLLGKIQALDWTLPVVVMRCAAATISPSPRLTLRSVSPPASSAAASSPPETASTRLRAATSPAR